MKKRFTVTLDEGVVKRAKKRAIDDDTNFSSMVENLLVHYLSGGNKDDRRTDYGQENRPPVQRN